jgi:DNA uptake protein ComE-like DNA-binding protein
VAQLPKKPVYENKYNHQKYNNDNYNDHYNDRKQQYYNDKKDDNVRINLQNFDPNTADLNTLMALGMGARAANSIINYREKGGKFKTAADLQKIYTLKPETYQQILPYIAIAPPAPRTAYATDTTRRRTDNTQYRPQNMPPAPKFIELNTADSTQLIQIKGIGAYFAKAIIKYRNRLGGYHNKTQLMEVFKIDAVKYSEIERYFTANPVLIKKININEIDAKTLGKHPYVGYENARSIIAYRTAHGKFSNIAALSKMNGIDAEVIKKIEPYLSY